MRNKIKMAMDNPVVKTANIVVGSALIFQQNNKKKITCDFY